MKLKDIFLLSLLTAGAFVLHGFHPAAEDAEIYNPGILKLLNPALYPANAEFFQSHARLTLYPNLIAASVRITHLPFAYVLLLWHVLAIFLVLVACWKLSEACFTEAHARWAATAMVAALLTLPVAGTALYLMDQYVNPREIALFAALFALLNALRKRYTHVALWIILAAAVHPLMSVFGLSLVAVCIGLREFGGGRGSPQIGRAEGASLCIFPLGFSFAYPSAAYREVVQTRAYYFLLRWEWYEWFGIIGPLVLFWWFSRIARSNGMTTLSLLCRAAIVFEVFYFLLALIVSIPLRLVALARYQPMRSLQLVYVLLCLAAGGLLGKFALKDHTRRWLAVFLPLCAGMFFAQRQLFPSTPHIEWPGAAPKNDWLRAFAWIRENSPTDALFALNPEHMRLAGEDHNGFRALAERSMLADAGKDAGAVTMFPDLPLAEHWQDQMNAQRGWDSFQAADFARLHRDWEVTWIVWDHAGTIPLDCPYANATLRVCRLN